MKRSASTLLASPHSKHPRVRGIGLPIDRDSLGLIMVFLAPKSYRSIWSDFLEDAAPYARLALVHPAWGKYLVQALFSATTYFSTYCYPMTPVSLYRARQDLPSRVHEWLNLLSAEVLSWRAQCAKEYIFRTSARTELGLSFAMLHMLNFRVAKVGGFMGERVPSIEAAWTALVCRGPLDKETGRIGYDDAEDSKLFLRLLPPHIKRESRIRMETKIRKEAQQVADEVARRTLLNQIKLWDTTLIDRIRCEDQPLSIIWLRRSRLYRNARQQDPVAMPSPWAPWLHEVRKEIFNREVLAPASVSLGGSGVFPQITTRHSCPLMPAAARNWMETCEEAVHWKKAVIAYLH
jgi:hypothetical protein